VSVDTRSEAAQAAASNVAAQNVQGAVETVSSHLHPVASYDLAQHPKPTGLEEVWRFTPLKRLGGLLDDDHASIGPFDWAVDAPAGVTASEIGTEEAISLGGPAPSDRIAALAVAHGNGAVRVDVAAETELDRPLVITVTGSDADQIMFGHLVITVGAFAKATIVLEHHGAARYGSYVTVLVGDGAQIELVSLQLWDDTAVHAGQVALRIGRDAQVKTLSASLGGDLVRLVETADYSGPGGELQQNGIYFADAGQHLEHRLFVDHTAPRTRSNAVYKGALQGKGAHTVWVGNVLIRKVAEGIETYEQNRNLVLTDGCQADSIPNLEIETGEIEGAGHASTTGRFDDEQLFYLQSRGVSEEEARRLVVHGFFNDIIRKIGIAGLEDRLMRTVEDELEKTVRA
jgi:Fe-S cluster assembly protein SufD